MIKKTTSAFLQILLCACLLLVSAGPVAWAQAGRGGISGTVTDPSGALVPGAKVTALNHATGIAQSTVSTGAGLYSFVSLNPGSYKITASRSGFESVAKDNVVVSIDQASVVNIALQVGSVSDTVTVSQTASAGTPRSPSARRSSRISWMAAARLSRLSAALCPCPFAPGISGDQATNHSPSRSMTAVNWLRMG